MSKGVQLRPQSHLDILGQAGAEVVGPGDVSVSWVGPKSDQTATGTHGPGRHVVLYPPGCDLEDGASRAKRHEWRQQVSLVARTLIGGRPPPALSARPASRADPAAREIADVAVDGGPVVGSRSQGHPQPGPATFSMAGHAMSSSTIRSRPPNSTRTASRSPALHSCRSGVDLRAPPPAWPGARADDRRTSTLVLSGLEPPLFGASRG
jgi:hypothetical protein